MENTNEQKLTISKEIVNTETVEKVVSLPYFTKAKSYLFCITSKDTLIRVCSDKYEKSISHFCEGIQFSTAINGEEITEEEFWKTYKEILSQF